MFSICFLFPNSLLLVANSQKQSRGMQNSPLFQVLLKISWLLKLLSLRLVLRVCSQNRSSIAPGGGCNCSKRHCLPAGTYSWTKAQQGHSHHIADQKQNCHEVSCTFLTFLLDVNFCIHLYSQIRYGKVGVGERGWGGLWDTPHNRKPAS